MFTAAGDGAGVRCGGVAAADDCLTVFQLQREWLQPPSSYARLWRLRVLREVVVVRSCSQMDIEDCVNLCALVVEDEDSGDPGKRQRGAPHAASIPYRMPNQRAVSQRSRINLRPSHVSRISNSIESSVPS